MSNRFDTGIKDSQESKVSPIAPEHFDLAAYEEYEASFLDQNRAFWEGKEGLLLYRRVRGNGVFYDKCKDWRESLALQLGALKSSMQYQAEVANFLEPWYGIGYITAAYSGNYEWEAGQAPAVRPLFSSVEELLKAEAIPLTETKIGKRILEMEEFFLDRTRGRLPMSFCDVQSPLNMLSHLLPVQQLFYDMADEPDLVREAAEKIAGLLVPFLKKQKELIGAALVLPGHGFASSRVFGGIGMSNDNAIMIRPDDYEEIFTESDRMIGETFGGIAFHSCGNYERHLTMVRKIPGLMMADAAFSPQTDPAPNEIGSFARTFSGTGIVLNARAVGNAEESIRALKPGIQKGVKLIAVTYCGREDQKKVWEELHRAAEQEYS